MSGNAPRDSKPSDSASAPPGPPAPKLALSLVLLATGSDTDRTVVSAWKDRAERLRREYELIVATDAASDEVRTTADDPGSVRVIRVEAARGLGSLLRAGIEAARHPLLFYTVCDGGYRPHDLDQLLRWIGEVDLVSGYRVIDKAPRRRSWKEFLFRLLVRALFAVRLRDLGCIYLLARREIFARIPIQSSGPFAHVEILAKANFLGCTMTEAPVQYRIPAAGSASGRHDGARQLLAELKLVLSHPDFGPAVLPAGLVVKALPE